MISINDVPSARVSFLEIPMTNGMDPMTTTNGQKFLFAAADLQATALKAVISYQIETLSFHKRRCEQNVKLIDDLFAGGEFVDVFDVTSNFLQNATSAYATEAGNFARVGSRLTSDMARRVRRQAESAIEDIAASTAA
ncbi:phasin family protein [Mesorhizobium sp.]|uniref:phasin family protein n=2 Tax=Mesorhizobium sp. TaxID=1871066 RepID=UPI0025B9B3A2|nr:phasin family protein [Mesorhizobium sp.]